MQSNMKHTYQHPEITVVKIATQQIIAASPGYGESTNASSGNLSRGNGAAWDDEEEEPQAPVVKKDYWEF